MHAHTRACISAALLARSGYREALGEDRVPPIPHRDMTICLEQWGSPVVWIQHWVRGPSPRDEA